MSPPIIKGVRNLLARYDMLLCDVWGVIHDGRTAFPAACDALTRFRREGGTVVLVTNAPQPESRVAEILDEKDVPRTAWDIIVSSGEIALAHVQAKGYARVHHIGPVPRSRPLMAHLPGLVGTIEEADAIVASGLVDDHRETAEDYRAMLTRAHARKLPLVCANPDLIVDVAGRLYPCAGALGTLYAELGGSVYWAGKPFLPAYQTALARAAAHRGRAVPPTRVLAVGDALRTDLAGAAAAGVDALFVASGIHRHEAMTDGAVSAVKLAALFAGPDTPPAIAAIAALTW